MTTIQKLKAYPWHPYLVCLYCLTKANADLHISTQYWVEILGLFLFFAAITAIFQFVFKFIWSSNTNGSIVLSIGLFILFFLYPIHKTINYILPIVERVRYSFLIVVLIGFIIALFLFIKKSKHYTQISQYLNVLIILFIGIDIYKWVYDDIVDSKVALLNKISIYNKNNKYNIYLIVPDGYASNTNLKKYWYFDNNAFISDLDKKGFFIPKNPRSNYRYTVQSISSMLNLNYFETSVSEPLMAASVLNNTTMQFLHQHNYKCYITDWDGNNYTYDPYNVKIDINAFLYNQSAAYFLGIPIYNTIANNNNTQQLESLFTNKNETPLFYYIHSMLTHHPYKNKKNEVDKDTAYSNTFTVYGKWLDGQGNDFRTLGKRGDSILLNKYLSKIKETNNIIQDKLNEHWNSIKNNSIIIVMSDHGFRFLNGYPEDFKQEAYQNFCAIYFPDQDYSTLTDTITPINVLRMSVNKAVGTKMPYLPDKTNMK